MYPTNAAHLGFYRSVAHVDSTADTIVIDPHNRVISRYDWEETMFYTAGQPIGEISGTFDPKNEVNMNLYRQHASEIADEMTATGQAVMSEIAFILLISQLVDLQGDERVEVESATEDSCGVPLKLMSLEAIALP